MELVGKVKAVLPATEVSLKLCLISFSFYALESTAGCAILSVRAVIATASACWQALLDP